jgi:4-hydroxy-tetrahydrodipicolinate reductase
MNIAILGYGRMGQEVEKVLMQRGHNITYKIDKNNLAEIANMSPHQVDVAIEFTIPEAAYKNILKCFDLEIPVVSGTTGWTDRLSELRDQSFNKKKGFLHSSNFSVGVNILFAVNKKLAKIMNTYPEYTAAIEETHHTKKLDSPSGTAITLTEGILQHSDRLKEWNLGDSSKAETLAINSIRKGEIPGIHEVIYDSSSDTIKLSHSAKSREGFALGAVLAAEFMKNKRSYYEMKDVLNLII